MSVEELISEFNALVGKRYWTSSHAVHDATLIDALIKEAWMSLLYLMELLYHFSIKSCRVMKKIY